MNRLKLTIVQWIARRLPPCDEIVHQLSDDPHRKRSLRERIITRLHLLNCVWCTRFRKQMAFIDRAGQTEGRRAAEGDLVRHHLPAESRERLLRALDQGADSDQ